MIEGFAVVEFPDVRIVMSDGHEVSARVWMPSDTSTPVPGILEYLPYRKRDGTSYRDELTHPWFCQRGYACLRVDIRGTGDSDGIMLDEYTPQELSDAAEIINWIAIQSWCNGNVGMMGISWGGFNCLQVAAMEPHVEPLKAIITLCSTVDRYHDDVHYKGGCLLNENFAWGSIMWSYSSLPPDPVLVGKRWKDMWMERLQVEPFLPSIWLRHTTRDAYWKHGSVCENYGNIRAATLAIGGWNDGYKNAVPALVHNISSCVKGIVGPWGHKYPHFACPGPAIGFLQEACRWWDRWLKDVDTGVEDDPALRLYLLDSFVPHRCTSKHSPGRWICEPGLQSTSFNIQEQSFVFTSCNKMQPAGDFAPAVNIHAIVSSPMTCGLTGPKYCSAGILGSPDLSGDQRIDDAYSACFDSEPFQMPILIVGRASVALQVKSSAPQAHVAIRLCDVHEDGTSTLITYGVFNLCHHNSHSSPSLLDPKSIYDVRILLDYAGYRLPAGHRLRVAVSSSYWRLLWPAPERTVLTISAGSLDLPIRLTDSMGLSHECTFLPPITAPQQKLRSIRAASSNQKLESDYVTGVVTMTVTDDFGEDEICEHGLIAGSTGKEVWNIHPDDPLSARVDMEMEQTLARGDWKVRTVVTSSMTSDASHFHLSATIRA